MSFLYPAFLFASFTILIPVIIHLFNFRQHKIVYFSNISFLKSIKEETKSKSQLKHFLILLSRIFTILCLVLAFSQPFIPNENINSKTSTNQIGIYLDNSFSMNSEGKFGNIFESSKNIAISILDAFSNNTEFIYIDNDLKSNGLHLQNKETVLDFILEQEISANTKNISEINSTFLNLLSTDSNITKQIYFISDFQKTRADFENLSKDSNLNFIFIPVTVQKNNNLFIDSVWFDNPFRTFGNEEKIFVNIVNSSDENYLDVSVNLFIDDSLKTVSSLNVDANSTKIVELDYTNTKKGILNCKIEITDYPITFDNVFYFNYEIKEKVNLLIINEISENKYLKKLFSDDENIEVVNFNSSSIKSSEFVKFDAIILCELKEFSSGLISELSDYISSGGSVLLIPNIQGNIKTYNQFLAGVNSNTYKNTDTANTRINSVNLEHILYKDVFNQIDENSEFPLISEYYKFNSIAFSNDITLLGTENSTKVLSVNNYDKGLLYVLNIPLGEEYSNFSKHPIFVPTLYNIVLYCTSKNQLYYKIGENNVISLENLIMENAEIVKIVKDDNSFEFIPQIISSNNNILKIDLMNNVNVAGNYYLKIGDEKIAGLSFNYSREESIMDFYTDTEISNELNNLGITNYTILSNDNISIEKELKQLNYGIKLWKLFLLLALIFIGIEIVLIKLWK